MSCQKNSIVNTCQQEGMSGLFLPEPDDGLQIYVSRATDWQAIPIKTYAGRYVKAGYAGSL